MNPCAREWSQRAGQAPPLRITGEGVVAGGGALRGRLLDLRERMGQDRLGVARLREGELLHPLLRDGHEIDQSRPLLRVQGDPVAAQPQIEVGGGVRDWRVSRGLAHTGWASFTISGAIPGTRACQSVICWYASAALKTV